MSVTVLWAAKGGSGTTVVTAALALASPTDSLLVDLAGDLPTVLGVCTTLGQGIGDWIASDAPAGALDDLTIDVGPTTRLISRGARVDMSSPRWPELLEWLDRRPCVYIDAGTGRPAPCLLDGEVRTLLVTRACYIGLQRAAAVDCRPDGVILVCEPGRSLRAADVERSTGSRVVAAVSVDPAVARCVDAGLLSARVPRLLQRELRRAATASSIGASSPPRLRPVGALPASCRVTTDGPTAASEGRSTRTDPRDGLQISDSAVPDQNPTGTDRAPR